MSGASIPLRGFAACSINSSSMHGIPVAIQRGRAHAGCTHSFPTCASHPGSVQLLCGAAVHHRPVSAGSWPGCESHGLPFKAGPCPQAAVTLAGQGCPHSTAVPPACSLTAPWGPVLRGPAAAPRALSSIAA